MHKIEIGKKIIKHYPEVIEEMTSVQFVAFSELIYMYQSQQITFSFFIS